MKQLKRKAVLSARLARLGAVVLVVFMGWLLQRDLARSRSADEWVDHTLEVLRTAAKARESVAKLDSVLAVERGRAGSALEDAAARLLLLTGDNPVQHARAEAIAREAAEGIEFARQNSMQPITIGRIEAAQARGRSLYSRLTEFQDEERRLLSQRRTTELREEELGLTVLGALAALCSALAALAYFQAARHRREYERVEQQMRDLVENLPLAAWQVEQQKDGRRRFLYLSPAAERERGWDAAELKADFGLVTSTVLPHDLEHIAPILQDAQRDGGSFDVTYRARGKDGRTRWIHSRAHVRPQSNDAYLWSGYWRDVSREIAIEQQLKDANRQLQSFSSTVSHDLRTPLAAVMAFASAATAAGGSELPRQIQDYLGKIRASASHMQSMIEALLGLSRLSLQPIGRSKVDLGRIAVEEAQLLRVAAPDRQAAITVQEGLLAEGDAALLRQVMANLLGNAWKFTGKTADAHITVGREADGRREYFFVRDNGVGFDPAQEEKLFRPFQRLHRASDFPGAGIGLATVARIIERHGGRIWAESRPREGACFYFSLSGAPTSDS